MGSKIYDASYILAESLHEVIEEGGNIYDGRAVFNKTTKRAYHSEYRMNHLLHFYNFKIGSNLSLKIKKVL